VHRIAVACAVLGAISGSLAPSRELAFWLYQSSDLLYHLGCIANLMVFVLQGSIDGFVICGHLIGRLERDFFEPLGVPSLLQFIIIIA